MNRFKQREQAFYLIFEHQFNQLENSEAIELYSESVEPVGDYAIELFKGVKDKESELEEVISQFSNGWKLNRLPKVNLAILKLALYEIKYVDSMPEGVVINEAVELAKKYSGKDDPSFVNGILGAYSRSKI